MTLHGLGARRGADRCRSRWSSSPRSSSRSPCCARSAPSSRASKRRPGISRCSRASSRGSSAKRSARRGCGTSSRGSRPPALPPSRRIAQLRRLIDLLNSRQNQLFAPRGGLPVVGRAGRVRHRALAARIGPAPGRMAGRPRRARGAVLACRLRLRASRRPVPGARGRAAPASRATASRTRCFPVRERFRTRCTWAGATRMLLVSGSNMSGKSTLLRSVGTNAVLALAGAPVRAERLRISPLAVGATLRVQDSLQAGQSRFYAEITRVRAIVSLTAGRAPGAVPARRAAERHQLARPRARRRRDRARDCSTAAPSAW